MFISNSDISDLHKKLIKGESLPENFRFINALSSDKEIFIVVHECRIDRLPDDKFKYFYNDQEPVGNNRILCVVRSVFIFFFYIFNSFPIPDSFSICNAEFKGEKLVLKSTDNKTIEFDMEQWNLTYGFFAFPQLCIPDEIITNDELEQRFYNLPNVRKIPKKSEVHTKKRSYINVTGIGRMKHIEYSGTFEICKNHVIFAIDAHQSEKALKASKDILKGIYDDLDNFTDKMKAYAVEKLLIIKNYSWLEYEDKPLTAEEFLQRIYLSDITVTAENIDVTFNDDNIFYDHFINIITDSKGEFIAADLY